LFNTEPPKKLNPESGKRGRDGPTFRPRREEVATDTNKVLKEVSKLFHAPGKSSAYAYLHFKMSPPNTTGIFFLPHTHHQPTTPFLQSPFFT
jgi:hypothetical protein